MRIKIRDSLKLSGDAIGWLIGGILSLIGYLLPRFREDTDYGWSYGGWYHIFDEWDRNG